MSTGAPHFLSRFVQLGYVTSDLNAAIQQYTNGGVSKFLVFDTRESHPHVRFHVRAALAWTGPVMIELIEPIGHNDLYAHALPSQGFGIQLHHTGYLVEGDVQFSEAVAWVEAQKFPIASRGRTEGVLEMVFADARKVMGHYLEIINLFEKGREMFRAAPSN
jgi:hypothetical protein